MRVDKAERGIRCQGNALAGWPDTLAWQRVPPGEGRRAGKERVQIQFPFREIGQAVQIGCEFAMLAGLDQSEMALRQRDRGIAHDAAEHGQSGGNDRLARAIAVARAGDAVQHDAADPHLFVVQGKATGNGRGRLGLAGDVQDQEHRQGETRSQVGRRAVPSRLAPDAIEQAHRRLDQEDIGPHGGIGGDRREQVRRHGPAVQIDAGRPRGGRMKRRIYIVGSGLAGPHNHAATAQRGNQRERHGGFAAAGAGGGDDQAVGHAPEPVTGVP